MNTSDQLTYSTVQLSCLTSTGVRITGTGFFVKYNMITGKGTPIVLETILTNRHVMENVIETTATFCAVNADGTPNDQEHVQIAVKDPQNITIYHPDGIDLCAVCATSFFDGAKKIGRPIFATSYDFKDIIPIEKLGLTAIEDVIMVGYPNSLIDKYNNKPIVRKGITATHPARKYNGKDEFVIDMACFPGSSGSPVLLYSPILKKAVSESGLHLSIDYRITLLGILYAGPQRIVEGAIEERTIPMAQVPIAKIPSMINLGYVINSSQIGVLLKEVERQLKDKL